MVNFKKELNKEQQKVISNGDGPCLVLAGAGSGKTRTITYRVAYLLEQGVDPKNILLVTFTNKAAREMISRVQELTGGGQHPPNPPRGGSLLPWSGTFHHVGYRILRKYAPVLGYKNNFTILDSQDSLDLLKTCIKLEGIDRKERRFPSPKVLQSIISYARNAETTIEDVLELKYESFLPIVETIKRIADEYRKRKLQSNAMDFDDLLVNLHLLLLKSEQVRNRYAQQFKYVLVDEYQDTNKVQSSIVKLFASKHKNLLVVGDDAQSIYSFRAADIQNILQFERDYPKAKIFRLETNYRSTPDILNVANDIISNNLNQHEKNLKSLKDNFTKPEVHALTDQIEEAKFITDRILELKTEGVPLNKMAVLFRAAFHTQALEMELAKRDIPYDYRGGIRFFERAHIKDVLAYLRIVNNVEDTVAWSRVLNMQVGIGPASVEKILNSIGGAGRDLPVQKLHSLSSLLSARGQVGWNDFLQIYSKMEKVVPSVGSGEEKEPSELIKAIINSKYKEYLENEYPDYRERLQDLEQLALFAERELELSKFLAEATLQESFAVGRRQAQNDMQNEEEEEKLILSTIHQAKGLEWEAVFVLNLSNGQFPNDRATRERNGVEEERRLFYVAVTRAQKYLYLTYPIVGGFSSYLSGPSMFLEELNNDLIYNSGFSSGGSNVWDDDDDPSDDVDDVEYVADDGGWGSSTSFLKNIDDL